MPSPSDLASPVRVRMRRRLRKKLHREYLYYVLYYVSAGVTWRAHLFESPPGVAIPFEPWPGDGIPPWLHAAVRRLRLRFLAAQVPREWARGDWDEYEYEHYVFFRVWSVEFPDVHMSSANNPETMYGRPYLHRW